MWMLLNAELFLSTMRQSSVTVPHSLIRVVNSRAPEGEVQCQSGGASASRDALEMRDVFASDGHSVSLPDSSILVLGLAPLRTTVPVPAPCCLSSLRTTVHVPVRFCLSFPSTPGQQQTRRAGLCAALADTDWLTL